jgi:hypothetical protein
MVSLDATKIALGFRRRKRPDFRVGAFAVLHLDKKCMVVKLTVIDQSVFCAFDDTVIYPVPGCGVAGLDNDQQKVKKAMLLDAVTTAENLAPANWY